jgi:hypothetical protein
MRFVHARPDYRYSDEVNEDVLDRDGYAPLDLFKCVPVPKIPRKLDWDIILEQISQEEKLEVRWLILEHYLDDFIDGDHKICIDTHGTLRYITLDNIELPLLGVPLTIRRAMIRNTGYSLAGMNDLSSMGHHGIFQRSVGMVNGVPHLIREDEVPCWYKH